MLQSIVSQIYMKVCILQWIYNNLLVKIKANLFKTVLQTAIVFSTGHMLLVVRAFTASQSLGGEY